MVSAITSLIFFIYVEQRVKLCQFGKAFECQCWVLEIERGIWRGWIVKQIKVCELFIFLGSSPNAYKTWNN